jgi:hypothetical protein
MRRVFLALTVALCFAGCPAEQGGTDPQPVPATPEPATPAAGDAGSHAAPSTAVYDVICGCALDEVGHCGEYAKVDGAWVEIVGDHGLGDMPFCGKTGLKAEVSGHPSGGKLHAHAVKIVE